MEKGALPESRVPVWPRVVTPFSIGGFVHVWAPCPDIMGDHRITVLPGDGTGREVALEAQRILDTIQANTNHGFDQTVIPCGGQHYLSTGEEWAPGSFEFCRDETDAIFLGAIGQPGALLPNGDLAGGSVILGLRSGLDLYANVRPIKLYEGVPHKIHGGFRQIWGTRNGRHDDSSWRTPKDSTTPFSAEVQTEPKVAQNTNQSP